MAENTLKTEDDRARYRYAALRLDDLELNAFETRAELGAYCKTLTMQLTPYITFERRERLAQFKFMFHPCETRFFDPDKNGGK